MSQYINLVNPALLPPKPFFQFRSMMLSLAAVALLLLGCGLFIQLSLASYLEVAAQVQQRVKQRETQLAQQSQNLSLRQKDPQLALDLAAGQEELARLQQIAASLPGQVGAPGAASSLQALSAAVLPGVWLGEISLQEGQLSLSGYALRAELIPQYLQGLRQQAAFQGQHFASFELGRKQFASSSGASGAEALEFRLQALSGRQP